MPRAPKSVAPVEQKTEYFILDPDATEIAGQRIKPGDKTVSLTEAEASFYLASGAISTAQADSKDAVELARKARSEAPSAAEPPPADPDPPADGGKPGNKGKPAAQGASA